MTAATLAVAGWKEAADERIRRGSAARSQATMADDSAGQPAADALELVLGEQVLEVVAVQPAADGAEHGPDRQALQPSGEQAEEAPGERRGQGARQRPPRVMDLRLVLGVDLDHHLIEDRVAALRDPLVQLPADLARPAWPRQSRPAGTLARAALRRLRGRSPCRAPLIRSGARSRGRGREVRRAP